MLKTYTLKEKTHKVISEKKISIHYLLVDEEGEERKVVAIAILGMRQKIKSLKAIYQRETPLVEALVKVSVNDEVSVEFSEFNKNNPRVSPEQSKIQAANQLKEMNISKQSSDYNIFSVDPYRLLKLFLVVFVGVIVFW
jgi:hypothetical protein